MADIEDTNTNPFVKNGPVCKLMIKDLLKMDVTSYNSIHAMNTTLHLLARKYKYSPSKCELGIVYRTLLLNKEDPAVTHNETLWNTLINKAGRSSSGILNVSVSMPPDRFSCKYNCYFCPNEPGMPRSYLSNEDVFTRAQQVNFDTVKQVRSRLDVLRANGHPIDKLEFRVLGGTFSCYDHSIADAFIRDLYYAANTYYDAGRTRETLDERPRGTLDEEQAINVTAKVHVVGLGVETRPDEITPDEIIRFRRYGVTRVELGIQHTDDALLRKLNRGHGIKHSKRAIALLKDYGFKVEIHVMTDLPGATPEGDMECYKQILQTDSDLIPDYMKDYPCLDVDYTKIKEWKAAGKWMPYSERTPDAADLKRVLVYRQSITPPWVRVNRIQRDFKPACGGMQLGYTSDSIRSNLAQLVKDEAEKNGIYCKCIRCCEVHDQSYGMHEISYVVRPFTASGAQEYFISAEVARPNRPLLLGFLRLRLSDSLVNSIIPELRGATAMIRELHVYGRVKQVGSTERNGVQHLGIGKHLVEIAERLAIEYGMNRIAVISGIGVRDYYRKLGYALSGTYMIKSFVQSSSMLIVWCIQLLVIIFLLAMAVLNGRRGF